jgi:hypothetical protein
MTRDMSPLCPETTQDGKGFLGNGTTEGSNLPVLVSGVGDA